MTNKTTDLVSRWYSDPGKVIAERIYAKLRTFWQRGDSNSDELRPLLAGLPLRNDSNGLDFRGLSFGGVRHAQFRDCNFSYGDLIDLMNCDLSGSRFDYAHIEGALGQILDKASFVGAKLRKCDMRGVLARHCTFRDSALKTCLITDGDLSGSSFAKANCRRTSFIGSNLSGCDFSEANLTNAHIDNAIIDKKTSFQGANLTNLSFAHIRDSAGQLIPKDIGLRFAKVDEKTKLGDNPAAGPLSILRAASQLVPSFESSRAKGQMFTDLFQLGISELKTVFDPYWYDKLRARLPEEDQEVFDEIMAQALKDQ